MAPDRSLALGTTVDEDDLAGHVACFLPAQETCDRGDIFRPSDAAHGNVAGRGQLPFLVVQALARGR